MNKQLVGLWWIVVASLLIWGCNDDMEIEDRESSITIETRFVNSDSVTVLDDFITKLTEEISSLSEVIAEQQAEIDSLNTLIEENPEDPNLMTWENRVIEVEEAQLVNNTELGTLQTSNSTFTSQKDSLEDGYSTLISITNLQTGFTEEIDSLLTSYPLPLDFNTEEASYRIIVGGETADITLNYSFSENISIEGRISLSLDTLAVTQNGFDSLTLTDETLYIFHY